MARLSKRAKKLICYELKRRFDKFVDLYVEDIIMVSSKRIHIPFKVTIDLSPKKIIKSRIKFEAGHK